MGLEEAMEKLIFVKAVATVLEDVAALARSQRSEANQRCADGSFFFLRLRVALSVRLYSSFI